MGAFAVVGLDDQDEAVYRALLRRPDLSATALADVVGVAVVDVRRRLGRLRELGLVRGDGRRVTPVRPEVALEPLLAAEQERVAAAAQHLAVARAAVDDVEADFGVGADRLPENVEVEIIDGLPAIRGRIGELVLIAKHELLSIGTDFGEENARPEVLEQSRQEDALLRARGLRLRTVYDESIRDLPALWEYACESARAGEAVRIGHDLPPRMLVFDRETAVLPLDAAHPADGAIVIWSRALVQACVALFEHVWNESEPLFATGATDSRQEELLALLAHGASDEAAARRLGIGVRTVRRDLAVFMTEVGARTRFQAGALAATRRGAGRH